MLRSLYFLFGLLVGNAVFIPSVVGADRDAPPPTPDQFAQLLEASKVAEPNDPVRGIELAREALALAEEEGSLIHELQARSRLAYALRLSSRYVESQQVAEAGLARPPTAETRLERVRLLYDLARVYWNLGDNAKAAKRYVQVQREAEALPDDALRAQVLNSRGILAGSQNFLPEATDYYQEALALAEALGDRELESKIKNNLALVLRDQKRYDEARSLLEANLAYHLVNGNRRGQANALINLASIESVLGRWSETLDLQSRALAIRQELGVPRHVAAAHLLVADALTNLGKPVEALAHLQIADRLAAEVKSHELWGNIYTSLANAHEANREFELALGYQRRAEQEKVLVTGEATAKAVAELRERFEAEKRQLEIAELQASEQEQSATLALNQTELSRTRQQRLGLLVLIFFSAITVAAVIRRQRAEARAERLILAETQRARQAAEDAARLKSRLVDLVSHDLKNPLVGMMMTADTMGDPSLDQAALVRRAAGLKQESRKMFELVQDLLDSSAAESGLIELEREATDLAELVEDQVEELRERAIRKNQDLSFTVDDAESCLIKADTARLAQVVENLVDNAIKYSPPGSPIEVRVTGGEMVYLEVRDRGPGFSAEDLGNIFKPHHRLSAIPTAGESSTGLGLSIAKMMVELHGGRLTAESPPGGGAVLTASFPQCAPLEMGGLA